VLTAAAEHRITPVPRQDLPQLILGRRTPVRPLPLLRGALEKGPAGLLVDLRKAAMTSGGVGQAVRASVRLTVPIESSKSGNCAAAVPAYS